MSTPAMLGLVNLESNPFLHYLVADDEELARYRIRARLQRAQTSLRTLTLYPNAWNVLSSRHLALVGLQRQCDMWDDAITKIVGYDWQLRSVERQILPNLSKSFEQFGDRLATLAELTQPTADETLVTLSFWCEDCASFILDGVTPKSLGLGHVYVPELGSVYRWEWQRLTWHGEAMVSCRVNHTGLYVANDADPKQVYAELPSHDRLGFAILTARLWPDDERSRLGLIRQAVIRSLTKLPRY